MVTCQLSSLPRNAWLKAASITLLVGLFSSEASASRLGDWYCLTDDLQGDSSIREEYIRASSFAAQTFGISPPILAAIKRVESGRGLDPYVAGHNTNGTTDRGFYQINTEVWLPVIRKAGARINVDDLHGVRQNALIAAWVLRRQMNRSDVPSTLEAVGYYHKGGGTSARAHKIRQIYKDKFMRELRALISRCG